MLDIVSLMLNCQFVNLFRKDRTRNGGGCAIYVYVSINVVHIDLLLDNSVETLWCKIKPVSGEIMLLCCVYRPPSSSVKYFDNMLDNIEKALNINDNNIDISNMSHPYYSRFMFLCELFNLTQLIDEPTRVTPQSKSTIDLICTTVPDRLIDCHVVKCTLSDHYLIAATLNSVSKSNHKIISCRTYKHFSAQNFLNDLSDNFEHFSVDINIDVNQQWDYFKNLFLLISNIHAPYRNFYAKAKSTPWVDNEIVNLIRERDKLHRPHEREVQPVRRTGAHEGLGGPMIHIKD